MHNKEKLDEFMLSFDIVPSPQDDDNGYDTIEDKSQLFNKSFNNLSDDISEEINNLPCKGKDLEFSVQNSEHSENIEDNNEKVQINDVDIIPAQQEPEQESSISDETNRLQIVDHNIKWMLATSSGLYKSFYDKKRELIVQFTPGGQLPFDQWMIELINCSIDTKSEIFDNNIYIKQLDQVQQMRERVRTIQLKCNNQYYIWERFIELLQGCLARIEYLKPQVKQEGLIHEHMRDVELYFARLKDLHYSCLGVMKILDGAFENLSRKVTITSMSKDGTRYGASSIQKQKPEQEETEEKEKYINESIDDYDDLPMGSKVGPEKKDINFKEWGKI